MAISSSLYSSISGLSTMGEAMSVLGDNVANTNTLSFKASRTTFQDVLAQSVSTASGAAQVGRGVTLSTVDGLFAQGSFETSTTPTDMAIGGEGFFILRAPESAEGDMYTRAGEFRLDKEGFLVNPSGNFVQGYMIDQETQERIGDVGDMRIDKTTAPVATLGIEVIANLDARKENEQTEQRLFDRWNGINPSLTPPTAPIDPESYDYTSAIKVYDSKGASHNISIYFDRTTVDNQWEFLVTCDPQDDMRYFGDNEAWTEAYAPDDRYNYTEHQGAGALMYGIIDFNTNGDISKMVAYDVPPDGEVNPARTENQILLDPTDRFYSFEANFTGTTDHDRIELNLGAQYTGVEDTIPQTLVSELGGIDGTSSSGEPITAETYWADVTDASSATFADGYQIVVAGFNPDGNRRILEYTIDTTEKVQDFLTQLESIFGNISASIDADGRLKLEDQTGGESGFYITRFEVYTDATQATAADVNPFGVSSINGQTVLNITTPKTKIFSQGQALAADPNGAGGPDVSPASATTIWSNVYDGAGNPVTTNSSSWTFSGTKGDGNPASLTFEVVSALPASPAPNTAYALPIDPVETLLEALADAFECDVEIDAAGRLVLTDRVADSASDPSDLAASVTAYSGPSNPWDDDNVDTFYATYTIMPGTDFYTLAADTSGEEDYSQQGTTVQNDFTSEPLATTQYANSSTTIFQDQNGFASGFLQSVAVDTDGVITGHYSNGQVLEKAQVALAKFASLEGLHKRGGNIYTRTTESGKESQSVPGTIGLGTIAPNALEMSNVDLGTEFVKLITVQRAFQANSKIITVTDEMLNDLINIKR